MKSKLSILFIPFLVFSCSNSYVKKPSAIEPQFINPALYENFDCVQLMQLFKDKQIEINKLSLQQGKAAQLSRTSQFIGGIIAQSAAKSKDKEQELSKSLGESKAIESMILNKKCSN